MGLCLWNSLLFAHTPHTGAAGIIEWWNGLLKTQLWPKVGHKTPSYKFHALNQ